MASKRSRKLWTGLVLVLIFTTILLVTFINHAGIFEYATMLSIPADDSGSMVSPIFYPAKVRPSTHAQSPAAYHGTECPEMSPFLKGWVVINETVLSEEEVLKEIVDVKPGGWYQPLKCRAKQKLAVIVPYRARHDQLMVFLRNIHPVLQRQQRDYTIFIVEQAGNETFNRGKLLNVGYNEAMRSRSLDCFVFHDIDLLPENDNTLYECDDQPRHLSVAMSSLGYSLPYKSFFGGVEVLTRTQFSTVNGFPNVYWGWGGEDDDLALRVLSRDMKILRHPKERARFKMLKHNRDAGNPVNPHRISLVDDSPKRFLVDGLSNLVYTVRMLQRKRLYTWILVDVGRPPA